MIVEELAKAHGATLAQRGKMDANGEVALFVPRQGTMAEHMSGSRPRRLDGDPRRVIVFYCATPYDPFGGGWDKFVSATQPSKTTKSKSRR